ncbi:hypothetical protein BpHYR1_023039 [Brachionus plicatilis]|uniref:Uncharacterized protein n=1 Tax=Brachionus plicatilis TaxID=10195 RepID=A0A3M7QLZ8_BRAPC|nr:hypothetical protein BpHYR1_023039 [Brachionus plicatilis]
MSQVQSPITDLDLNWYLGLLNNFLLNFWYEKMVLSARIILMLITLINNELKKTILIRPGGEIRQKCLLKLSVPFLSFSLSERFL